MAFNPNYVLKPIGMYNNISTIPQYSVQFGFEKEYSPQKTYDWMVEHWVDSIYWSIAYAIFLLVGKHLMAKREPFKIKKILFFWNLSLALFSIFGAMRMLPELFYVLKNFGFHYSVCKSTFGTDSKITGYWTYLFVMSKVPELCDTVFIILRKQKLIFLHWYHHITVLIFTWYSSYQQAAPARWYINMNYSVHACMYSYFALRSLGIRIPRQIAMFITLSQIAQMMMGFYVTYYSYVNADNCDMTVNNSFYGLLMYASYFALFLNFFIQAYFGKNRMQSKEADTAKKDKIN